MKQIEKEQFSLSYLFNNAYKIDSWPHVDM